MEKIQANFEILLLHYLCWPVVALMNVGGPTLISLLKSLTQHFYNFH